MSIPALLKKAVIVGVTVFFVSGNIKPAGEGGSDDS
jgi:hypothetical protein